MERKLWILIGMIVNFIYFRPWVKTTGWWDKHVMEPIGNELSIIEYEKAIFHPSRYWLGGK